MGLYPVPDLDGLARQHGVGLFTLGFLQSTPTGEAAWAGLPALSLTSTDSQAVSLRQEISQLRAVGGDAMVSFGGASGTSLAESFAARGSTALDLANRYRQVVDTLALNRIDFDIEGAALANRAANQLQANALRLLQQSHPGVEIWLTLPVLPQGLGADALEVVRQILAAGVKLDGVNIMAMDFGDSAAPPALKTMGQYAIDAANASFRQLSDLHRGFGQGFGWNQLGVTPMIGVNDVTSEVFRTTDAQLVKDFARLQGLGMLSMWSIARDKAGPIGQVANTHSGTAAADGSYCAIWGDYGTDPVISGGSTVGATTSGTTTAPATGGSTTALPSTTLAVAASTTSLTAKAGVAERFQLSYAWGRRLTINGFDPSQDVLDLKAFWAEGQQAKVVASSGGATLQLDFNAQQVLLPGVAASALTPAVVQVWQG
jgi:chitinase